MKTWDPEFQHDTLNVNARQVGGTHYTDMPVQPWAVMEAVMRRDEFIGYLKGCIIKYSMRQGKKEGSDDAGKLAHYIEKLKEATGHYPEF